MSKSKYILENHSVAQLAYLAGIIDSRGSVYIGNFNHNKKTGSKYYQTNIEITSTDKNLIDWIVNAFGGKCYAYNQKKPSKNSKSAIYRWICTGEGVTYLTKRLLPYLIIKIDQMNLMIKMRETYKRSNISKKGIQGIQPNSPVILELRQTYFEQMQALHYRNYNNKEI